MDFIEISNRIYYGNSAINYFYSFTSFIITICILVIIKTLSINRIIKIADKTKILFDDLIDYITKVFNWHIYILIALYVAFKFITTPKIFSTVISYIVIALGIYYIIKFIQIIIDIVTQKTIKEKGGVKVDKTLIDFIARVIKILVWVIAILIIVQNLGYDVTALMAGLGVGGIAIAFALQNVLKDLFASLSIFFDKPFELGDYISVGKDSGTITKIGLRSTRLKTFKGVTLIISNKEIVESRVYNFRKMEKRRIFFKLRISYETPSNKLKKIPKLIEDIISNIEDVNFERIHFVKFDDYSLVFNVAYLILSGKYTKYLDINQEINYQIREVFEKEEIKMAYPTQTLFVKKY